MSDASGKATPGDVIGYWLGPVPKHPDELEPFSRRWYRVDADVDAEITQRFGQAVEQARSVALFERLVEEAEPTWRDFAASFVGYATAHRRVIERFGRFPHRNAALGRESTAEEREYLEAGGGF